ERDIRIVGNDFRDNRNVFNTAQGSDLKSGNRHVFQYAPSLIGHPVRIDGKHAFDTRGVSNQQGGGNGKSMAAHGRKSGKVGLNTDGSHGVAGAKGQNQGGSLDLHGG